jgi:rhodanese-related sulfurtransferase/predicted metal-dependent enzyme (double-stranded beta helix superfamily)
MTSPAFQDFVAAFGALLDRTGAEADILRDGAALLRGLIAYDNWLPEEYAQPHPGRYTQYLLHRDPAARFSVVSFVWGPGQATPVHDHTVWGLVGVLRGAETGERFTLKDGALLAGPPHLLKRGEVEAVSPTVGDIHKVSNALDDTVSISIHVYGADIGAVSRHVFTPDGKAKTFISGYANATIAPMDLRRDLLARREIAILDLREEAPYAKDHPLFAVCLPLSRLEMEVLDRVPRKDTKIVLYDNGEWLVAKARQRLIALGYDTVLELQGGLSGWRDAGLELFQDVNSASKAFGELVEASRHTPSLPAPDAKALIENNPDVVVLDARRFEEYRTMSIPKGISVPGAELVLRARAQAPDPATTIIVNCAGRTRSIIGAQSLINAGVPNRVFALRNGTIGWMLAGQALERGRTERFHEPAPQSEVEARRDAREVAYRAGVRHIDTQVLKLLAGDASRTLYRFDVRTPEEYAAGHIPGFRGAPGGQLVQETDVFAPVRGARIVLADNRGARADMTASWLAQMGWDVCVLEGGFDGALETGPWKPHLPPPPAASLITADELAAKTDVVVIDLAPSPEYKRGHIPGAWFAIRAQLADTLTRLPKGDLVLTSPDGVLALFAAPELAKLSGRTVAVLDGGTAAWVAGGRALEPGFDRAVSGDSDIYRRPYEGVDNAKEAMQAYLDWEFGLVDQLARDATHGFYVI